MNPVANPRATSIGTHDEVRRELGERPVDLGHHQVAGYEPDAGVNRIDRPLAGLDLWNCHVHPRSSLDRHRCRT